MLGEKFGSISLERKSSSGDPWKLKNRFQPEGNQESWSVKEGVECTEVVPDRDGVSVSVSNVDTSYVNHKTNFIDALNPLIFGSLKHFPRSLL
jgi:hypothetical protein